MARRRSPGEGSIAQRKDTGRWTAQIVIGYDTKGNPKRIRKDFNTKREADTWLSQNKTDFARGDLSTTDLTLEVFARDFLARKERDTNAKTFSNYRDIINAYVLEIKRKHPLEPLPALGKIKLAALKPLMILRWIETLQNEGRSAYSVFKAHSYLSMILNAAMNLELIHRNPARKAKPPTPPTPELSRLPAPDVIKFLSWCADHGLRFGGRIPGPATRRRPGPHPITRYATLALLTGMRREELLGLRWKDIHFDRGYLEVLQTVTYIYGKATFGPPKTPEAKRLVMLEPNAMDVLHEQFEHTRLLAASCKKGWRDHGLVFPSSVGTPTAEKTIQRWWADASAGSEVQRVRLYDTRSTWGSEFIKRGGSPKAAAKKMGHRDMAYLMRRYIRPDEDEMRRTARGLEDMYGPEKSLRIVDELEQNTENDQEDGAA